VATTQYAIDIAAQLDGASATASQLDALADKLSGAGINAGFLEDAMIQTSSALDRAAANADAAATRLAAGEAEYAQLERAAVRAAKAAERAALKNKGVVPDELAAKASAAKAAVDGYATKLSKLEAEAAQASTAQQRLSRSMENLQRLNTRVNDRLGDAATKLSTFRGALGDVGGPLGELGERLLSSAQAFVDLRELFGSVVAITTVATVGFVALAAAAALVAAAFGVAVAAVAAYTVNLADSREQAALTETAFARLHPELEAVSGGFAQLTRDTGLATPALRGLTLQLEEAGVTAAELPTALRAAALAESALGQGGAAQFVSEIKAGKLAVEDFAATAEQKFGDVVARQMLGLEAQGARLQRNLAALFGGLEIEEAQAGMSTLVDLFDESSATGRTMKAVFEGLFQPLVDQAQLAAQIVEAAVIGMAIGALRLYVALKPAIDAVANLAGVEGPKLETVLYAITASVAFLSVALLVTTALVVGLAALIGGALVVALLSAAALLAAPFVAIGLAFASVVALVYATSLAIQAAIRGAVDFVRGLSPEAKQVGTAIVMGLAGGIVAAGPAVVSALTGVVQGALGAAKSALGIASPSRVMYDEIGAPAGEGVERALVDKTADVQGAMRGMVEPPPDLRSPLARQAPLDVSRVGASGGEGGAAPKAGGGGSSGKRVDLRDAKFNFYGVENAEQAQGRFEETLTLVLEGDALQLEGAAT